MNDQTAIQEVKSKITWVKAHEKLIALVLVLVSLVYLGNKVIDLEATKANVRYEQSQKELADQKAVNDTLAKQSAQVQAQYQQMVDTLTRQNAALASSIAARDSNLAKKQQDVKNMPLEQVAREWEYLLNAPQGVLSVSGSTTAVPEAQARQTVTELEKVPVLQADLTDETAIAANTQSLLTKSNEVVNACQAQVVGLNNTIDKQAKACKDEIDKVKADNRKSKRNWFIAGFVAGIATRIGFKF